MASPPDQPHSWTTFGVVCPRCGADASSPNVDFGVERFTDVPDGDYWLGEARCPTCDATVDLCLWLGVKTEFIKTAPFSSPLDPNLWTRYRRLVAERRARWDGRYRSDADWSEADRDLSDIPLVLDDAQAAPVCLPIIVLAAARGMREAVLDHPGDQPVGALDVGPFRCVLSLWMNLSERQPYVLHLSISRDSGWMSGLEQFFLLSLFFTPDETPLLEIEDGYTKPVRHFRLRSDSVDDLL
jgi:hypothetical protein